MKKSNEPSRLYSYLRKITILALITATFLASGCSAPSELAANPTFSLAPGTYTQDQSVQIVSATENAVIHYTVDGSEPNPSSPAYTNAIPIAGDGTTITIKAFAEAPGYLSSATSSITCAIDYPKIAPPTFSIPAGTYNAPQTVTLDCLTDGATIVYTLYADSRFTGETPGALWEYAKPIVITGDQAVVKIIAYAIKGALVSAKVEATYTLDYATTAMPTFSLPSGNYPSRQNISIIHENPKAKIYYTTDGSQPTSQSTVYYSSITIYSGTTTIKAMAIAPGQSLSSVTNASYTAVTEKTADPTFSLQSGTYLEDLSVTLECATPGATIVYTTDEYISDWNPPHYSKAIPVTSKNAIVTIKAKAYANGYEDSEVVSATYIIDATPPAITGIIRFLNTTETDTTIIWNLAEDDISELYNLRYKLVKASTREAIDSIEEANGVNEENTVMDWSKSVHTYSCSGLSLNAEYWFAVLVQDEAGRISLYEPQSCRVIPAPRYLGTVVPEGLGSGLTFGGFLAASGDYVIGLAYENSSWSSKPSELHILKRTGESWATQATFKPTSNEKIGWAADITETTAIFGAQNQVSDIFYIYVYVNTGGTWSLQQKIEIPNALSVSSQYMRATLDNDTLAVGNCEYTDDQGVLYVYARSGASWT